MTYLEGTAFML